MAVSAAALSGCAGYGSEGIIIKDKPHSGTAATDLRLFGYKVGTPSLLAIENTFVAFLKEHSGLNVIYEGIIEDEYYPAFEKRSETGNLSDAFMINTEIYRTLRKDNKLADLSDAVDLNSFTKTVKDQIVGEDGRAYFIPGAVSGYSMYVNYDLLRRENIAVPTNLSEFTEACRHFVSKNVIPVIINNDNALMTLIQSKGLYSVYQSADVNEKIASFNDNPYLAYEYLCEGIDLVSDMVDGGFVAMKEGLETKQSSEEIDLFVKGDRPFMIASSLISGQVKERFFAENNSFNYGIHPYPILSDGSVLAIDLDTCIAVNAEGANLASAKKLVSFMSKPSHIYDYSESQSSFMPLADCKKPSDAALAPSYDHYVSGKIVVQYDYRLTIEELDELVYDCGAMLVCGESKEAVKEYLEAGLIERGGRKI